VIIFNIIDIYLLGISTVLTFITAIRYFSVAKRKKRPNEKALTNAFALIFIFLTIHLVLLNLSFLFLEGRFIGKTFFGNIENTSIIYKWIMKGMFISFWAALIYYFYTYEKILNKKIHLATFLCVISIMLIILLPYEWVAYYFNTYSFVIITLYYFHTLFTLMKQSRKKLRAATSFIILGTLFIGLFLIFMDPALVRLGGTPIIVFPILWIVGTLLCMTPTIFNPKFFALNIKYWYLFGIIVTTVSCITLMYIIIAKYQIEYVLGGLILVSFCIAESIIAIRYIMQDKDLKIKNNLGISGIFTKPELVTEEEVSVSKEKKICIVCKRKLAGFKLAFICRECDTLYCEKCVRTLSKLENACWVCNAPFDETKPVKLPKKEKEEMTVQDIEEPKKAK